MFAEGVPLHEAFANAAKDLKGQTPIITGQPDAIPVDFSICPESKKSQHVGAGGVGAGDKRKREVNGELGELLRQFKLEDQAESLAEKGGVACVEDLHSYLNRNSVNKRRVQQLIEVLQLPITSKFCFEDLLKHVLKERGGGAGSSSPSKAKKNAPAPAQKPAAEDSDNDHEKRESMTSRVFQQQPQTSNANPTVLWEDTKKWVDQIRKASRSQAEFLGILQIDQETLQQWYANPPGRHGPPGTTTKLRQQIKLHLERQRVARNPDRVDPNPQNPNPQNPQQLLMQPTHPGNQPSAGYDRPNMQRQHPVQQHGSGHQGPHLAAGLEGQQAQAPQMAQMSVQSSHQAQQQQLSASQYARVGM